MRAVAEHQSGQLTQSRRITASLTVKSSIGVVISATTTGLSAPEASTASSCWRSKRKLARSGLHRRGLLDDASSGGFCADATARHALGGLIESRIRLGGGSVALQSNAATALTMTSARNKCASRENVTCASSESPKNFPTISESCESTC
jgi:hypothetical protein